MANFIEKPLCFELSKIIGHRYYSLGKVLQLEFSRHPLGVIMQILHTSTLYPHTRNHQPCYPLYGPGQDPRRFSLKVQCTPNYEPKIEYIDHRLP